MLRFNKVCLNIKRITLTSKNNGLHLPHIVLINYNKDRIGELDRECFSKYFDFC